MTYRSETDQIAKSKYDATAETDRQVIERVAEIASEEEVAYLQDRMSRIGSSAISK